MKPYCFAAVLIALFLGTPLDAGWTKLRSPPFRCRPAGIHYERTLQQEQNGIYQKNGEIRMDRNQNNNQNNNQNRSGENGQNMQNSQSQNQSQNRKNDSEED